MSRSAILRAARDRGVRLSVEDGRIVYQPRSCMTPELLAEIRANRDVLLEALAWSEAAADSLYRAALAYLAGPYRRAGCPDISLEPHGRVLAAYDVRDMFAYRLGVREWVQSTLRELALRGASPSSASPMKEAV